MTVKLNDYWIQRLTHMPETGMGYQKVDIVLKDGRTLKGLMVFNAEECQTEHEFNVDDIVDMKLHRS